MPPPPPSTLLFDLDGTLVETIPFWLDANVQALAERGVTMDAETFLNDYYHQGLHFHGVLEHAGAPTDHAEQWYEQRNTRYAETLRHHATWLPDAEETLRRLSAAGPLGLMTGSKRLFVDAIDDRLGLSSIFHVIVTQDDTGMRMKPDPYGLHLLADAMGADAAHCLYVGDQRVDLQAARAAGMRSCLLRGTHTQTDITPEEADIVLQDIRELPTLRGE
jgi:HAD superfamily hydrolase (TIGR01509 family)